MSYILNQESEQTWLCDIIHLPSGNKLGNIRLEFDLLNQTFKNLISYNKDEGYYIFDELYCPYAISEDYNKLEAFQENDNNWHNFGVKLKGMIWEEITEEWGEYDEDYKYDSQRDSE